jgi:hypothetical protein
MVRVAAEAATARQPARVAVFPLDRKTGKKPGFLRARFHT